MNRSKLFIALSVPLILVACGGGGSSDPTTSVSTGTNGSSSGSGSGSSSGSGTGGTVTPNTSHSLYVGVGTSSNAVINDYLIGTNGALTSSSVLSLPANVYGTSLAVDASGKHAYLLTKNQSASPTSLVTIYQYDVGTNGKLTPMAVPTLTTGLENSDTANILIDPTGKYVYVAGITSGQTLAVSILSIGADGSLTQSSGTTVTSRDSSINNIVINAKTHTLYAVTSSKNIASNTTNFNQTNITPYTIGSDGSLTAIAAVSIPSTYNGSLVVDSTGSYAYLTSCGAGTANSCNVYEYAVGSNGALTPLSTPSLNLGSSTATLALDSSGKFAYATNFTGNSISQFRIATGGVLTPLTTSTVPAATPSFIATNPLGGSMFVGSTNTGILTPYTIGSDGSLSAGNTATIGAANSSVSFVAAH
jgi:6-phosphogluconolactonase (cycloisomerase 2 family)